MHINPTSLVPWLLVLMSCAGTQTGTTASPLKSAEGPFQVMAREIRLRGSDQRGEAKPEIRVENNLRELNICDVRISNNGAWSANQLVTKDCLAPSSAAVVIPPNTGEWTIKVETNNGKTQTAVVQIVDLPVGISFAD